MNRTLKIQQKLNDTQQDAAIFFDANNITYISGFTGHAATVLVTTEQAYLLTDYRYVEQAKSECDEFMVICRDRRQQSLAELLKQLMQKHPVQKVAFEANHISHGAWLDMQKLWSDLELTAISRWVEDLRMVKEDHEIQSIQLAAHIADQALTELLTQIQTGITERELAIELEHQMALLGSEKPSFDTIMLAGERSALPHGIPGDNTLEDGDLLLVDFGAVINGYHSDMTRTFVIGEANEQQQDIYQTVLAAQQAAIDAFTENVSADHLNQQAQKVLNQSPYAQYQGEGLGHGLGMDLHEQPFIGMGPDMTIKKNAVVTIEPGIYIPGWGGVRIEDDVVWTDQGLQILTQFPRRLMAL